MILRDVEGGVEALAPAKLNLFLELLGKRLDGYHEVETLMVAVDLQDTLTFANDPSGGLTLRCDDPTLPTGSENLVVRAAELLRSEAGRPELGVTIDLRKVIPAQAGLAGGSSDAATTLAALNRLWGLNLPTSRLEALCARVGSDVAFFLYTPAAVGRGRGERVEPLALGGPLHFVLACPSEGVSTAEAYRRASVPAMPRPIAPALAALASGDVPALGRALFNRLQPAAESIVPALGRLRQALETLDPAMLAGSLMSGSGSAFFGLGRDLGGAQAAAEALAGFGPGRVRVVTCGP